MALIIIQSRFIESPAKIPTMRFADTAATSEYAKASDNIINAFESSIFTLKLITSYLKNQIVVALLQ